MTSAGRELLKWLALVLMTADHVNKALFDGSLPYVAEASRIVFPIFAVVFAYNMQAADQDARARAMVRLLFAAVIAQPFHFLAFGNLLTLNVLFTLLLAAFVLYSGTWWLSALAFLAFGPFVDYGPFGVAVFVTAAMIFHGGMRYRLITLLVLATASLYFVNGNLWALAALPVIGLLGRLPGRFPRWRWTFIAYYVGHLALLAILANC